MDSNYETDGVILNKELDTASELAKAIFDFDLDREIKSPNPCVAWLIADQISVVDVAKIFYHVIETEPGQYSLLEHKSVKIFNDGKRWARMSDNCRVKYQVNKNGDMRKRREFAAGGSVSAGKIIRLAD